MSNTTLLGKTVSSTFTKYRVEVHHLAKERSLTIKTLLDATLLPENLGRYTVDRSASYLPTHITIRLAPVDDAAMFELVAAHELGHAWLWLEDFPLVGSQLPPQLRPEWFIPLEPDVNSVVSHSEIDRRMGALGYDLSPLLDLTASSTLVKLPAIREGAWKRSTVCFIANALRYADFLLRDSKHAQQASKEYRRISQGVADLGEAIFERGQRADLRTPQGAEQFMVEVIRMAGLSAAMAPLRESVLRAHLPPP